MTKRAPVEIPAHVARRAATKVTPRPNGCRETTYAPGSDNPLIGWADDHKPVRTAAVARAAWVHYHGKQPPPGKVVRATCGNRRCCAREHLALTTRKTIVEARPRGPRGRFQ